MMKISVITATFNSEATLPRNLASISKQKYKYIEHVFIDNCSTDNTIQIVHDYKINNPEIEITIISEPDKGISDAFNKGIKKATGEVLLILNSDDFLINDRAIESIADIFSKNKNIKAVHGDMYFCDPKYGSNIRQPLLCHPKITMPINHPTFFVKKDVYKDVGVFSDRYKYAMDYDLICRIHKNYDWDNQVYYFRDFPITQMNSGGVSDLFEYRALKECKEILIQNKMYDQSSKKDLMLRHIRVSIKSILSKLGLKKIITYWRNLKWKGIRSSES